MSNYDRKMEARKEQAAKDKKKKSITIIVVAVVILAIIAAIVGTKVSDFSAKKSAVKDTYCKIGSHEITKVEYDYYYYTCINEYLQMYQSFLPYMGLDTSQPFDEQMYSDTMTWKDAFDQMTTGRIQTVYAYIDDSKANGFEFDADKAYTDYAAGLEDAAAEAEFTVKDYYKGMYGEYATAENLEPIIKTTLTANAYMTKLQDDNTPSDDEIDSYYEEHKTDYDVVDYYAVTVAASEDAGISYDTAKNNAANIAQKVANGEEFDAAANEFVPFAGEDTTYLTEDARKSYISSLYSDWLFDDVRKAGDTTVIEDADNDRCYAVSFVSRDYDEDCKEEIKSTLISDAVTAYMQPLFDQYTVVDVKGDLAYLALDDEDAE